MRRLTLSVPALAAALVFGSAANAQHHAAAPHASAPHMEPMHMQVPHMMQPQFFYMPQVQPQPRPRANNAVRPNHANAPAAHANNANAPAAFSLHANTGKASHTHAGHAAAAAHANTSANSATTSAVSPTNTNVPLAPGMTPDNTMHFPSNAITFPSQVSIINTGLPTLNFPSQASIFPFPTVAGALGGGFHFPSFVTNLGASAMVPGTLARTSSIPSAMLASPIGVGGMVQGLRTHYFGRRIPYYGSYGNYTNSNAAQQHMNRLVADLDALQPGFQTSASHHNRLQGDLMAVSVNYRRPSSTLVHQLARNLSLGMTRRQSPTINTAQLAQGLRIVVNGGHLAQGDVNGAIQQSQALLQQGGFSPADTKAVVSDMHALVGQARLNQGNAYGMVR